MEHLYLLLAAIFTLTLLYWYLTKTFNYWRNQNVPCKPNPSFGFGHMLPVITFKDSLLSFSLKLYDSTDASMVGFYFLHNPAILVRHPELVRSVLQTNYPSFRQNLTKVNENYDPVIAKNPFFVADPDTWKATRQRIANQFSGKKIHYLCDIVKHVCDKMMNYVDNKISETGGCVEFECELKEHFIKYTGEIVANAAFAIEGQSFDDNPDRLSFTIVSKNIFEPTVWNGIKQGLIFYLPDISNILRIPFLPKNTDTYFRENVKAIMKQRLNMDNPPNDFLQNCIEANPDGDIDNIIADIIIFHLDVYETSSTTLAIVFYQLSQHKHVQDKLRDHIRSKLKDANNVMSYECLKNMDYLEQVINESMRLIPPAGTLMKMCTEEITLTGPDGLQARLKPGNPVFISINGVQTDPNNWPDPLNFDPDRFSAENQANIVKGSFLPFGDGPRMCIGRRFAMVIIKMATITLLMKYSVEHSRKTQVPLEFDPMSIITYVKGGLWAKFKKLDVEE